MHIKTVCPHCESTFQVDPGLRGKRMRCPNALCRAVFEVREVTETPAAAPPPPAPPIPRPSARSGNVGQMVPMLPAEAAPETPRERAAPPAVPAPAATPAPLAQHPSFDDFFAGASPLNLAEAEPSPNSGPAFAGWDDAPPVRQEAAD